MLILSNHVNPVKKDILQFRCSPSETLARIVARCVGYGEVVDKYLENVEVSGERIRRELGFEAHFDLANGWRDAVQRKAAF